MRRRTKIVCTLGPAVDSESRIRQLIRAGMNVARINCSHGDWKTKLRWIEWIRKHSSEIAPVAILADLQGPKFRIGFVANGALDVHPGESLVVGPGAGVQVPIDQPEVVKTLKKGAHILLGDGEVELRVTARIQEGQFLSSAISGGTIRSRQGLTVVGQVFECETLTAKDLGDIEQACKAGVDYLALSYVHSGADMELLSKEVGQFNSYVRLCAKIETRAAPKNLNEIVQSSDAVMVARGDLGLQMPIEDVPLAQKAIIARCRQCAKPVITATQMLESMIRAPRPTRAEATDVANAILDGTDAVMLSAETAAGQFPIEAVRYMSRIAERAEADACKAFLPGLPEGDRRGRVDHTEAVAHGVVRLGEMLNARAIVTPSTSGRTAALVSKFRPRRPILCAAWNRKVQAQMALVWGVEAALVEMPRTSDEQIANAVGAFVRHKRLKINDQVIVTAGVPPGTAGNTNMIMVVSVKE